MKTRKFSLAQILTFVLAFVLTFAMAVPAFAMESPDDSMTIKILPSEGANTAAKFSERFKAYAVFVGTLDEKDAAAGTDRDHPINPNNGSVALYNLKWGPQFEAHALEFINFLKDGTNYPEGAASMADTFKTITPTTNDEAKSSAVADNVARILEANKDTANFVINFAKVAYKFIKDNKIEGNPSAWNADDHRWDIKVNSAGYYLILDQYQTMKGNDDPDEVTGFILAVLGDQFVNMKSKTPTVDKDIINGSYPDNTKGDTVNIGDTVKFRLTGTLSENYDQFETFKYVFHDTLSKGLTFDGDSLKVYSVDTKGGEPVDISYGNGTNYQVVTSKNAEKGTTDLTVTFNDLKTLKDSNGGSITITEYSKIIVEYTATVNSDAVIGSEGNPNDVYLEFSNDPFSDGTGKTTEKRVYVFSFGLDITKYGDDEVDEKTGKPTKVLKDAKFVLYRTTSEGKEYAIFTAASKDGDGNVIPQKLTGWVKEKDTETTPPTTLTTDGNGKILVSGLDAGTYTLEETQPPAGYNLMKPIDITITATLNNENGSLQSVDVTFGDQGTKHYATDSDPDDGLKVFKSGMFPIDPVNNKAPILPGTGGIGLVIFYVLGGLLLVGAATYIIVSGRKKNKQQQQ